MKKILFSAALVFAIYLTSLGQTIVAKGDSNSAFGNFKIVQQEDHMLFNNKELDKYLITYDQSEMKVMVVVDKQKKCKKYYVLSDKLPVQYECNGTNFGIKKLDKALLSEGYNTSLNNLNREEFYRQKILTRETNKTLDHLVLIASYYPGLFI